MQALRIGAARGINLAIVGPPGCGKSTVFEALDEVFETCGKPERNSSFPLAGVLDSEVLLWQEFTWSPKVCAFEDLLQMLCGEKIGIRVPRAPPVQHRNKAPMFYTAWAPLSMRSQNSEEMMNHNQAMSERFKIRRWTNALPTSGRIPKVQQCGKCFACFILQNA